MKKPSTDYSLTFESARKRTTRHVEMGSNPSRIACVPLIRTEMHLAEACLLSCCPSGLHSAKCIDMLHRSSFYDQKRHVVNDHVDRRSKSSCFSIVQAMAAPRLRSSTCIRTLSRYQFSGRIEGRAAEAKLPHRALP